MPVPKGVTLDPRRTRDRIIDVTTGLFYDRGLDGIGIAELCARAGISKETLYRHFGSKDGLVQAVLEKRSDRVAQWLRDAAEAAGSDPADQAEAIFGVLGRWYAEPAFRGCAIINAAVQQHAGPASVVAVRHLGRHLGLLREIAERAGAADPDTLARQMLMLIEGATVLADHLGRDDVARDAQKVALALLRTAGDRPPDGS
jgi:AcrR family transcriptional regulator